MYSGIYPPLMREMLLRTPGNASLEKAKFIHVCRIKDGSISVESTARSCYAKRGVIIAAMVSSVGLLIDGAAPCSGPLCFLPWSGRARGLLAEQDLGPL